MAARIAFAHISPAQLLSALQSGGPAAAEARDHLPVVLGPLLEKMTARVCRRFGLSVHDREEVLAEAYALILDPEIVRFVPSRGKPTQYLLGQVRNAGRKVMQQRGFRRCGHDRDGAHAAPPRGAHQPADHAPEQADAAGYVLRQAPPRVRAALELRYWEDQSISAIATGLGVSRFALGREVTAFLGEMGQRLRVA